MTEAATDMTGNASDDDEDGLIEDIKVETPGGLESIAGILDAVNRLDMFKAIGFMVTEKTIDGMLAKIGKLTREVEEQEDLEYEIERELMRRNPIEKLLRRDSELANIDAKLNEAAHGLNR